MSIISGIGKKCGALIILLICAGCGGGGGGSTSYNSMKNNQTATGTNSSTTEQNTTSGQQNSSSNVPSEDVQAVAAGGNMFALELYRSIKDETEGNIIISPYGISLLMSMLYAGAEDNTAAQIADTMHFASDTQKHHKAFEALDTKLMSRGQGASGANGDPFRLSIAKSIWTQQGIPLQEDFTNILDSFYGAGKSEVDFISNPGQAVDQINNWVVEQTLGKIEKIIEDVDEDTRLVAADAIYFSAAWRYSFDEALTANAPFDLPDGSNVSVPMMVIPSDIRIPRLDYRDGLAFTAIDIPYDGNEISMLIILPELGDFTSVEDVLDYEWFNDVLDSLDVDEVTLSMPKFSMESKFDDLKDIISQMGISDVDFSGIYKGNTVFLDKLKQKALIEINESGTVATAVTSGELDLSYTGVTLNRPFLFFIRDAETGTILFMGRVMNPLQS